MVHRRLTVQVETPMPSVHETAYPRLKSSLTEAELGDIFTPTAGELTLSARVARGSSARLAFLVRLKTFQRLGSFTHLAVVPSLTLDHIIAATRVPQAPACVRAHTPTRALPPFRMRTAKRPSPAALTRSIAPPFSSGRVR